MNARVMGYMYSTCFCKLSSSGKNGPHHFLLAHHMFSAYPTDHFGVSLVANLVSRFLFCYSQYHELILTFYPLNVPSIEESP